MTPEPGRLEAIFTTALAKTSPEDRAVYLDDACADDSHLRLRVVGLLSAHDAAGSFLQRPAGAEGVLTDLPAGQWIDPHAMQPLAEGPGTRIGPYKLLQQIGEGGMGVVWMAEQQAPIRRMVALKIIKPGMDSASVIARFEAERQALALMDHQNIARVFDGGSTDSGRPFFVMELVKGIPITRFCDDNRLTPRERLELFMPVCHAVQHAHQKGVIHRDLKPSNVLVTLYDGKPVPKVIDFGVAKALHQKLTEKTMFTAFGAVIGTLEYMSPEQAELNALDVDTRSDVYSLGVLLYELLTGATPLERERLRKAAYTEVLRLIREEEPMRPSTRLSGSSEALTRISAQRKTEPGQLARIVRGELDWIVMKSLEKERSRRYETASGLARDVERYLKDEPVEACPPSVSYRLSKFARKNRAVLSTVGAFVALLMVAVGVCTWLAVGIVVENKERRRAVVAEQEMREKYILAFAMIEALTRKGTKLSEFEKPILRTVLEREKGIIREPGLTQEARARAAEGQLFVANLFVLAEDRAQGEAHYHTAIQRYETLADEFPAVAIYRNNLARCNFNMARLLNGIGRRVEAEAAYRRAIQLHEKLAIDFPDDSGYITDLVENVNNLGVFLLDGHELAKAEKTLRQAIPWSEKLIHEFPGSLNYQVTLAGVFHNLGNAVRDQGNAKAALSWYNKAKNLVNPVIDRSPDAKFALRTIYWDAATAYGQLGQHGKAIRFQQYAIDFDDGSAQRYLLLFLEAEQTEMKLKAPGKLTGKFIYEAAVLFAQARAAAAEKREVGLEARYARRALDLLKQLKTAGWFRDPQHIKQLKEEKDFRSLPPVRFKGFLEGLETGKSPK